MRRILVILALVLAAAQSRAQAPAECSPRPRWLLLPSDTGSYVGYYVGGGCAQPRHAEPRLPDEGTWGWDYQGWFLPRRVILGWWHGRRYQGGTGAYKTDGPQFHPTEESPR
jgi:hypothetical protein